MVPAHDRFRALFDAEAAYVLGRLRWLGVPDRDRADVAQDIFLAVARHLQRLDPARPVRPWLLAITCNAARDYFKRAVRREQLREVDDPAREDRVLEHYDAAALVRRILATLRYDDREVLVLVTLEERPVPEVAELLGLSAKAVESRLLRARERFGAALERLQAAERRRLGAGGMPAVLADVDELVRAARDTTEDLAAEVAELRARVDRALGAPAPAPAATPAATWLGLALVTVVATFGLVDAVTGPPRRLEDCVPSAEPAAIAAVPPAPAASTTASSSTSTPAPSSSPAAPPARAPAPPAASSPEASEAELLALARRALHEGDRRRALVLLRRHESAFPHGAYSGERRTLLARIAGPQ
jgi:RNA polymerase sigma factor (sigma-70 family)